MQLPAGVCFAPSKEVRVLLNCADAIAQGYCYAFLQAYPYVLLAALGRMLHWCCSQYSPIQFP